MSAAQQLTTNRHLAISMSYIADLHVHSLHSRATSKSSTLHGLAAWAAVKGIDVVATGDFTHPGWFSHLTEQLEPAEPGLFRLRQPPSAELMAELLPPGVQPDVSRVRFVLSAEISSIYKRGGQVRKVHNLLYAPDLAAVRRLNSTLAGIGNLESDGRPILGLDSQTLLEILLDCAPEGFLVPAHVWTPWFSLFGSKSGFDAIEECFGSLCGEIFALETGLSSDPEMNRRISALDRFALISNSDCHSPSKLGREANVFAGEPDFFLLREALRNPALRQFQATIEFYPEEGKYHCDGHRKCGVCFEPSQTSAARGICPQCGRPLTVGVLHRVMELADREEASWPEGSPTVHSLVPLSEMLGELLGCGPATQKAAMAYGRLVNVFGSELRLLLSAPLAEIAAAEPLLAKAIGRVRENQVIRRPGFDGEFGTIRVFDDHELAELGGQLDLFGLTSKVRPRQKGERGRIDRKEKEASPRLPRSKLLNSEQLAAVDSQADKILVQAGPGTGKTHTLVQRAVRLLAGGHGPVEVVTFTAKAADEIRQRLALATHDSAASVDTFHGFCLRWLRRRNPGLSLAGPELRRRIFVRQHPQLSERERSSLQRQAALFLAAQPVLPEAWTEGSPLLPYFAYLRQHGLLDLDEVVPACTALLHQDPEFSAELRSSAVHLLVDEFQDLNASQYELVRLLSQTSAIFAIGDPDQAIYGFRGANPAWFRRFAEEEQPECHRLTINYRSGSTILSAAAAVIEAGREAGSIRHAAKAASERIGAIHRHAAANAAAEADFVAEQVQHLLGGTSHREIERLDGRADGRGLALSDIAVLYRTSKQAALVAQALAERTIPCQLVDLQPFYLSGSAKVLYCWILLAACRIDQAELLFLLGLEPGIGTRSLAAAEQLLAEQAPGQQPLAALDAASTLPERLRSCVAGMREFASQMAGQKSARAAAELALARCRLSQEEPDLVRFLQMASSASSLAALAEHLLRHQDSVVYDERAEAVLLATLHAAKGLEFKAVFLIGCEEGLLPLTPRAELAPEEEEEHFREERRLFFVGITRAAEVLHLTCARERLGFAGMEQHAPSRFLADIPEDLLSQPPLPPKPARKRSLARQLRLF